MIVRPEHYAAVHNLDMRGLPVLRDRGEAVSEQLKLGAALEQTGGGSDRYITLTKTVAHLAVRD